MTAEAEARPSIIEIVLVVLELLLAVGALGGGLALIVAPNGSALGMALGALARSPFGSYLVPGVLLVLFVGVLPVTVAVGTLMRREWALWGHLAVGAVLVTWIIVQVLMIGFVAWLQPIYAALGVAIGILGGVLVARAES